MKLTLLVCLLGVAVAADQAAATTTATATTAIKSADDTETADAAQSSNEYGYQAPQEAEPSTYTDEPVAYATEVHHHHYRAPAVCYSGCDAHSSCYNRHTGQCAPKVCDGAHYENAHYAEASYAPAEEQEGYRHLQYEDESYAAPVEYGHQDFHVRCGCPSGFKDSRNFNVRSKVVLWVAFGLLFAPAFCFLSKGTLRTIPESLTKDKNSATRVAQWEEVSLVQIGAGVVCLVASLAYLTMALGHGFINKCDGRAFYYARYVDWALTTPIMLWDLCKLAGEASDNRTTLFIVFIDFIMIASGLIGGLITGTERWAFFGFSIACFLPIIYFLCYLDGDGSGGFCGFLNNTAGNRRKQTYRRAMNLTVLSWIGYPIIWAVAEGGQNLSATGEAIAYTVLDIISKSVFGWIIVYSEWGSYLDAVKDIVSFGAGGSSML